MFSMLKERREVARQADKRKEKARSNAWANSGGRVTYAASDSYDSSYSSSSCSGPSSSYDSGSSDSGSSCD